MRLVMLLAEKTFQMTERFKCSRKGFPGSVMRPTATHLDWDGSFPANMFQKINNKSVRGPYPPDWEASFKFDCLNCFDNHSAMSISKTIILALGSLWFASANVHSEVATNSNAGQLFKFKFELNKPLIYAVEIKTRTMSDESVGSRSLLTRNSSESRYKIRLTAVSTNQNGTTTIYYEPFDYQQDIDNVGASGRITTSYRGLDVVSKQNDIAMVDTTKGIGMSQAKSLKLGIYPCLLSGYMDLNPAGAVTKLDGDLPFIDQWQENFRFIPGFFHFAFPTNAISIRDSWTNYVAFKSTSGVIFNGDGIIQTNVFTRELDSTTNNNPAACFTLYESDIRQNMGGYFELSGQRTSVNVPQRTQNANATFHFDQKLGRLIDVHKSDKMTDSVSMMYQGNPATSHHDSDVEISMQLISP